MKKTSPGHSKRSCPPNADSSFAGEVHAGCVDVITRGCDVPALVRRTHSPARDLGDAKPADELRFDPPANALRPARLDANGRHVTADEILPELGTLPRSHFVSPGRRPVTLRGGTDNDPVRVGLAWT